jgi:hypothetical protein
MDTRDYSKNYAGAEQAVKTTHLILVKSNGEEVVLDTDQLEALIALLD